MSADMGMYSEVASMINHILGGDEGVGTSQSVASGSSGVQLSKRAAKRVKKAAATQVSNKAVVSFDL